MTEGQVPFIQEFWRTLWLPWLMGLGICAAVCPAVLLSGGDPSREMFAAVFIGVTFGLGPVPTAALATAILRRI